MKTRIDFVSNSSSCSFILKAYTFEDVDKIMDFFKEIQAIQPKAEAITESSDSDALYDVYIYCGDDTLKNIGIFKDIQAMVEESGFKAFNDKLAHYSFGEKA